jgi:hypothetical protein
MSKNLRLILLGGLIGFILSFLISGAVGSIIWFKRNPSPTEMRQTLGEHSTLSKEEFDQVMRMVAVGAVLDFVFKVGLIVVPSALVGTGLGLAGGFACGYYGAYQQKARNQITERL